MKMNRKHGMIKIKWIYLIMIKVKIDFTKHLIIIYQMMKSVQLVLELVFKINKNIFKLQNGKRID